MDKNLKGPDHKSSLNPTQFAEMVNSIRNTENLLGKEKKMISKKATEVHGGMGFTDLLGLHYWFKRIGVNRQILGTPDLVREEAAKAQNL